MLGAAILLPTFRHLQLKEAVKRFRAELRARGESMELAQVLPPPVPPEQNSVALLTNAVALLSTNRSVLDSNQPPTMRFVAPGKALIGWAQRDIRYGGDHAQTNSWEEFDAALAPEKTGLDLLRQLPARPQFDFGCNSSKELLKHVSLELVSVKKAAFILEASASSSLHHNDSDTAARDILAIQSLLDGLAHERVLTTEMLRMALAPIAIAANWEFLQATNITDAQLAALQRSWEGMEFIKPFESAMAVERASMDIELKTMRDSNLRSYFGLHPHLGGSDADADFLPSLKLKYKTAMWRYWWSYSDELRCLAGIQAVLDAARRPQTNGSFLAASGDLKKRFAEINGQSGPTPSAVSSWFDLPEDAELRGIFSSSLPAFSSAFNQLEKFEAARQLTITAIALARFHLKHGHYPPQLAALVPDFLASVPRDPVDARPLRYQCNPDGTFLLYSVGEDGVNNAGDPTVARGKSGNWLDGRDWVWPQPATAAEIKVWAQNGKKSS
jgi:hypothetical protein